MLNKIRSKINALIAIEVIITMALYYFILVGATTISYAIDLVKTTNSNVNFLAYFINENGEKVETIEKDLEGKENYLYVDIAVQNDGYLNGKITLDNSNFNILPEILSSSIQKIDSNEVTLKQINAGDAVTIKLKIEPRKEETINKQILAGKTKIILEGQYINSKNIKNEKNAEIKGEAEIELKWKSSNNIKANLEAKVLTNSIYQIQGGQKRIVQILVNSKIDNNSYPAKDTEITLDTLQNIEEVEVHARSTAATNVNIEFNENNYIYDKENKKVIIKLFNNNEDKISWKKDAEDSVVVTFILNKEEDVSNQKITVNSKITTYDEKELTETKEIIINENKNNIISSLITPKENYICKGKIYTGEEREYITKSTINIDFNNVVNSINLKENESKYLLNEEEIEANIVYKETKIKKEEFLKIFGENGFITIKDQKGTIRGNINKNSTTNENGEIIINFIDDTKSIELIASKPITVGKLDIENKKVILNSNYSQETIDQLTAIKESEDLNNVQNTKIINLNNTQIDAALDMDVKTISTMNDRQEVTIEATLLADNESKDLYKNPTAQIILPKEISVLSAKYAVLYNNGLKLEKCGISKNDNEENQIQFIFNGEQQKYDWAGGTKIYLKLEVKASKLTPSKTSFIKMIYTNEKRNQVGEKNLEIKFESQYGLMTYNQIRNINNNGDTIIATNNKPAYGNIDANSKSKEIVLNTALINNYEETISNVTLIGTIPFENSNTNFKATLNKIETNNINAKVLYSPNPNAIKEDDTWSESIENAVSYKIVLDKMNQEKVLQLNVTLTIPENIEFNKEGTLLSNVSYEVQNKEQNSSSNIVLKTEEKNVKQNVPQTQVTQNGLDIAIVTNSGEKDLSENEEINEGQTIKYKVTVTNNSGKSYTNVTIKAKQKNGYVWDLVEYDVDNWYDDTHTKQHLYEVTQKDTIVLGKLETLNSGESYTFEYEANPYLLNNENIEGNETNGTISIVSEDNSLNENVLTIKNIIKKADLRLELKELYTRETKWFSDSGIKVGFTIENLTAETKENVEVQAIFSNNLALEGGIEEIGKYFQFGSTNEKNDIDMEESGINDRITFKSLSTNENGEKILTMEFSSIKPNENIGIWLTPETTKINQKEENVKILTKATVTNNTYYSNQFERVIYNNSQDITLDQTVKLKDKGNIDYDNQVLENQETLEITGTIENHENQGVTLNISYDLDESLKVQSATLQNGNETTNLLSDSSINHFERYFEKLEPNSQLKINIIAKVNVTSAQENEGVIVFKAINTQNFEYYSSEKNISINIPPDDDSDMDDDDDDDDDPGKDPGENPGEDPGEDPGDDPGEDPGDDPGEDPGEDPGDDPGEDPGKDPGEDPRQDDDEYEVNGTVWLDANKDGKRTSDEEKMEDIEVGIIDTYTGEEIDSTLTDENGEYSFNVPEGNYIVIFKYDYEIYGITNYHTDGISSSENSDAVSKKMTIDDEDILVGATDNLEVKSDLSHIDLGLIIKKTFDLKIDKSVSKITVTNNAGTKTYEQKDNTTLAKVDIHAKNLKDSLVVIEYKLKITNVGEIEGYVGSVVDYLPNTLKFNSSLNSDWYQSEGNLYNTSLSDSIIEPGETKELTLILTKTMTETNTGLINNNAQIDEYSNPLGIEDETENKSFANVIISVSTGALISYFSFMISTLCIIFSIVYLINRKRIKNI